MQLLFESSEESPGVQGLGIIKGKITRFDSTSGCKIPQIGWNGMTTIKSCSVMDNISQDDKVCADMIGFMPLCVMRIPLLLTPLGLFCPFLLCFTH